MEIIAVIEVRFSYGYQKYIAICSFVASFHGLFGIWWNQNLYWKYMLLATSLVCQAWLNYSSRTCRNQINRKWLSVEKPNKSEHDVDSCKVPAQDLRVLDKQGFIIGLEGKVAEKWFGGWRIWGYVEANLFGWGGGGAGSYTNAVTLCTCSPSRPWLTSLYSPKPERMQVLQLTYTMVARKLTIL